MQVLRDALVRITQDEHPLTVRHAFYVAIACYLVEKDEKEYKGTICRLLTQLRRQGLIPFEWISDNTRWTIRSRTYRSAEDALRHTAAHYRRNLWDGRDVRVEVWCEKDAVAGILSDAVDPYSVPVMVFRGYSSVSYLYSLAEEIKAHGLPTWVYYFGDHDPSGKDLERFALRTVREMAPAAELHFRRLAVTPEQIGEYGLPTRPVKKKDSRAKGFKGPAVEVDALSPRLIERLAVDAVLAHVSQREVQALREIEQAERENLACLAEAFGRGGLS